VRCNTIDRTRATESRGGGVLISGRGVLTTDGCAPCTGVMLLVWSDVELDPLNDAVELLRDPVDVAVVKDAAEDVSEA